MSGLHDHTRTRQTRFDSSGRVMSLTHNTQHSQDKLPCLRRDSNPNSQKLSDSRSTPQECAATGFGSLVNAVPNELQYRQFQGLGQGRRYSDSLRTGQSGSNPSGGEICRTRQDQPWGPLSLLYKGYWVSFPGVKRPEPGVDRPPPSSAEVKERVELYLYFPSELSWPVLGCPLPFLPLILTAYEF